MLVGKLVQIRKEVDRAHKKRARQEQEMTCEDQNRGQKFWEHPPQCKEKFMPDEKGISASQWKDAHTMLM